MMIYRLSNRLLDMFVDMNHYEIKNLIICISQQLINFLHNPRFDSFRDHRVDLPVNPFIDFGGYPVGYRIGRSVYLLID